MHRLLLFIAPVVVPVIVGLLFRKLPSLSFLAYIITPVCIFYVPRILFSIDNYLNPPPVDEVRCGNVLMAVFFLNVILCIPISLAVQLLVNLKLHRHKVQDKDF
jgi:hypothetical protein